MKKIKSILIIGIFLVLLVGCSIDEEISSTSHDNTIIDNTYSIQENKSFEIKMAQERMSIDEYKEQYKIDIEELISNNNYKIDFKECDIKPLTDFDKVGIYQLKTKFINADESIDIINKWLKTIGCDDLDIEKELRDASGQYESVEANYPYDYPSVYEHYPEFNTGSGFFINTNQCYIQMGNNGIYSMSDGSITHALSLDSLSAMDALGINSQIIVNSGMSPDEVTQRWKIADGEMSVCDASKMVKQYFMKGTPGPVPNGITIDIPEYKVFSINDLYGYAFSIRRKYNNVPFAYATTGSRIYYNNEYEILEDIKTAYMIEHDKVAAFTGYNEAEELEPLIDEQNNILSIKDAVLILDDFLAGNVKIKANRVEFAYCICVYDDGNKIAYPCWDIDGINCTNNNKIRMYVNALSGDIYYYSYSED